MTHKQLSETLALEINASYARTMTLVADTRSKARESIREAICCGAMLAKAKDDCGHGHWLAWLKVHCPDISEDTAYRWMKLSNSAHVRNIEENAASLRQAYILAGIIDEGDCHTQRSEGTSKEMVERLALPIGKVRAWFNVRMQRTPIEQWTAEERVATKAQLEPLIELYHKL